MGNPFVQGIELVLGLCAVALLAPAATLLMQAMAALGGPARVPPSTRGRRPRTAVLIPAHDESLHLHLTLVAIHGQLMPGDRVVVVADNCTDETAAIASSMHAEVVERFDADHLGKGYALDHGMRHLASDPPDVVVVIDADCVLHPEGLQVLARRCGELHRPVQALYLLEARADSGLADRLKQFGWLIKNHVRPRGMARLGGPCQLMGSGMALPWSIFSTASLATGNIVEDLHLGLELAQRGRAPQFCEDALVTSGFPLRKEAQLAQLTRWEHGHLAMIANHLPRLLWRSIADRNGDLAAMALDLGVPPLAWLALVLGAISAAAAALTLAGASPWPALVAIAGLLMIAAAVLASWWGYGRAIVSLAELMMAPAYAVAKVPMYMRLIWARQTQWVRTDRDQDGDPDRKGQA